MHEAHVGQFRIGMSSFNSLSKLSFLAAALGVGGCALPAAGPTAANVEATASPVDADYYIVPLATPVVKIMGDRPSSGFPSAFHLAGYRPSIQLRPGDVIGITVFETGGTSVFGALDQPVAVRVAASAPDAAGLPSVPGGTIPGAVSAPPVRIASLQLPDHAVDATPTGTTPLLMAQVTSPPTTTTTSAPPPSAPPSPPTSPTSAPAKTTTFPALTVESNGTVLVPYVGPVQVGGLTPLAAAERIRLALSKQALRPQVLVSVLGAGSNTATVGGEAGRPGPVALTLRGERLLDVVGQAGGSKWPAPDTDVDIVRGSTRAKVKLQTVVEMPSEDIAIRPNDQIFLTHNPRSFTVLGASQKVSQYTFDVPKVSLAEAVGRAGGAIDTVGNPAAVYLFREEPTSVARSVLAVSASTPPFVQGDGHPPVPLDGPRVRMVYRINMASAEGYFLGQKVMMRDKDVVLIANAEGTQLLKAFTLARGVSGIASDLNLFGIGGPLGSSTLTR